MAVSFTSPVAAMAKAEPSARAAAGIIVVLCLGLLLVAASISPSPEGHGSHTQLGLPPCGWVLAFNKPCVTCGMTTSFSAMAHGQVLRSFITQPAGAIFCIAAAALFWLALHTLVTGSRAVHLAAALLTTRVLWIAAGILAAAWAYKWFTWPAA